MFRQIYIKNLRNYISKRAYSIKSPKKDEMPSFKNIALVGIIGTGIFIQAVNSMENNRPKTSYSEAEFNNVMNGLRRKITIFQQNDLNITFVSKDIPLKTLELNNNDEKLKVIKPSDVVNFYRTCQNSNFEALLNELYESNGENYVEKLPQGMLVMLLGKYMKEHCKKGDTVVIPGFPLSIKDAIKFENEISIINRVIVDKKDKSDISKYYDTVGKVKYI